MKKLPVIVLFATTSVVLFAATSALARTKTLFYMADHPDSVRDFMGTRPRSISSFPPGTTIDANGLVYGEADPVVMRVVKQRRISLFPIVAIFDRTGVHTLLTSDKAQIGMIGSLISECKRNGYDGFQLDFENIAWTDRDDLSATVERIAHAMHQERLQLQIAVVPNAPGYPGHTAFSKWIFSDRRGVFDLNALSDSVDLTMTYDQHTRRTAPGPVGGWMWIAVADSSKLGMISPHQVCEAAQIDTIISDDSVAPELLERFRHVHIQVPCV